MSRATQILIGVLLAILAFGLSGQYGANAKGTVDVSIVALWLFAWLGDKKTALSFAVILGIIFDFISFTIFGYWLLLFIGLVVLIDWLKTSFLTESSFIQSILVLALITLLSHLLTSILLSNLNYVEILISIVSNVLVGSVLYYLFAIKLKMFQRWTGKRL